VFKIRNHPITTYINSYTELDVNRIPALTDAIFAVAMTLLILEIKIPAELSPRGLTRYFTHKTLSELFIYFVSFVTLGIFWIGSHFHHNHITRTDRISSWLNIFYLMAICIIPFSAGLLNHYQHQKLSIIFYSGNLIVASLFHFCMLVYAWRKKYVKPHFTDAHYKNAKHRIMIPIYVYIFIIMVSFFSPAVAVYLFLIPFILHILPESGNKQIGV
jgi:uncharacterized membrane protein